MPAPDLLPLLAIPLLLGGLELLLRVVPRFRPAGDPGLERTPEGLALGRAGRVLRHRKNSGDFAVTVAFNRHGIRDRRVPSAAPEGALFVVGDSFSFGWGVEEEERYSNRLEQLSGLPVLNLAAPCDAAGYGAQLAFARREGAKVERVVAGLCMERDVKRYDGSPTSDPRPGSLQRAKSWLARHSALYIALTSLVHGSRGLGGLSRRLGLVRDPLVTKRRPYDPRSVQSTAETMERALSDVDALVLLIPSRALWHGDQREDAERTHAAVAETLAARGFRVVDCRPAFEAGGRPLAYHFENDPHWTPEGHRVAASLLARAVHERGWGHPVREA